MVEAEAAQRGVLQAILSLHTDGTFTAVLDEFYRSVVPKYFALDLPIVEPPVFNEPPEPPTMGSYDRFSRDRRQRHQEYEDALQAWAQRFRLTRDMKETGECLPWILDFGRALCKGPPFTVVSDSQKRGKMPPPGDWVHMEQPNPRKENFSDWLRRNRSALKEPYSTVRERQRPPAYPDPAKRKPEHYRWFVLNVCGGLKRGEIVKMLNLPVQEDAIRKGIDWRTVRACRQAAQCRP